MSSLSLFEGCLSHHVPPAGAGAPLGCWWWSLAQGYRLRHRADGPNTHAHTQVQTRVVTEHMAPPSSSSSVAASVQLLLTLSSNFLIKHSTQSPEILRRIFLFSLFLLLLKDGVASTAFPSRILLFAASVLLTEDRKEGGASGCCRHKHAGLPKTAN